MNSEAPTNEIRTVRADQLRVHPTAQRRLVPATLRKILSGLDLDAIGTLHAVEYAIDGVRALWIVDGQHRLTALMKAGCGEVPVKVEVHAEVQDDARASALFLKLNTRAAVTAFDGFCQELQAGYPEAVGVSAVTSKYQLSIDRTSRDGTVTCVTALKGIYAKDDGAALDKTLRTATAAWGRTSGAVEGKLLEGIGEVFARYNGQVDIPVLVKKLAKYPGGAPGLLGNAKSLKAVRTSSLGRCVAEMVVETYNKGRRIGVLEAL